MRQYRKIIFSIFVLVDILTISSCSKSDKEKSPTFVTVKQLQKEIEKSNDKYKVVFIYDTECGQCERHFRYINDVFYKQSNNGDDIEYLLVTLSDEWKIRNPNFEEFIKYDNVKLFSIRDTTQQISTANEDMVTNIVGALIQDTSNVFLYNGYPYTIIYSKDTKQVLKTINEEYKDKFNLCNLVEIGQQSLSDIDFSKPVLSSK